MSRRCRWGRASPRSPRESSRCVRRSLPADVVHAAQTRHAVRAVFALDARAVVGAMPEGSDALCVRFTLDAVAAVAQRRKCRAVGAFGRWSTRRAVVLKAARRGCRAILLAQALHAAGG